MPGIPGSGYAKSVLLYYLERINYTYDSRFLFTASFRSDGSSRFSKGNKWGYFPSGAFAWRISNEEFMKESRHISDLKLRTSWGFTGSQAISRSEEHTSELQSLLRISYAVLCLNKTNNYTNI